MKAIKGFLSFILSVPPSVDEHAVAPIHNFLNAKIIFLGIGKR